LAAIVLLAVVAALAVWWSRGGSLDAISSFTRTITSTPAPAVTEPEPEAEPEPVVAAPQPSSASERDEAPADEAPAAAAETSPAEPAPSPALQLLEDADRAFIVPLEIEFGVESWTEVTDGRGERLAYGLQPAGRRLTVRGAPPFAVVLGDARSVRVTIDGLPYEVPPTRRGDNSARFSVDIDEE
jgi:cytoskeleton protein RodZ